MRKWLVDFHVDEGTLGSTLYWWEKKSFLEYPYLHQ
jgi:hypothetical protein